MLPIIMAIARQYAPYIVLPFAGIIGTIGYYAEKRWNKPVVVPYMSVPVQDARHDRQLTSEVSDDFLRVEPLQEGKKKFVPPSSLDRNPAGKKFFE